MFKVLYCSLIAMTATAGNPALISLESTLIPWEGEYTLKGGEVFKINFYLQPGRRVDPSESYTVYRLIDNSDEKEEFQVLGENIKEAKMVTPPKFTARWKGEPVFFYPPDGFFDNKQKYKVFPMNESRGRGPYVVIGRDLSNPTRMYD